MRYSVIVADPAWSFDDGLKKMKRPVKRSAASQYKTMSLSDIMGLEVASLADPKGCLLALWVPGSLLQNGLDVMRAWGFRQKQIYVWVKVKKPKKNRFIIDMNGELAFGMGRVFRQTHEIALIGTSGKSIYPALKNKSQRSVSLDANDGHSVKPPTLQDKLEIMFPEENKLELFARRKKIGWTCFGDALGTGDIAKSIQDQAIV
jgi:N6-adenosine-specific RNA methylase IME4